jgi:proteasome accessory factor C
MTPAGPATGGGRRTTTPRRATGGAREQVSRLLALVPYLQGRGEVSVEDAARAFGVSPRTIQRDLGVLLFCGLPGLGMGDLIDVDFDALEGEGVIRLSNAEYLARPLRLDSSEAAALMVALRALREGSGEEEREVVDRALDKIAAAAGDAASAAARVDVRPPEPELPGPGLRADLERAVVERRQVRLRYFTPSRDAVTDRVVDPVAVADARTGAGEHAYLDAWCHLAQGRRLFRLDRIEAAELLGTPVEPHPDLAPRDLAEGLFVPGGDAVQATVELSPEARWVAEYHPVEEVREDRRTGVTRVRLRAGDERWLVRLLLRLGGTARVVEPAALAEQVRTAAAQAIAGYDEAPRVG